MILLLLTPMLCTFAYTFGKACLIYSYANQQHIQQADSFMPDNTTIAFDLHGVLFKHDYADMLRTFIRSNQKWFLIKSLFHPCLIWDILKLLYHRPVPESFFMHLAHNWQEIERVLPLLIRIANCQKANRAVIHLVKTLREKGYELAIISNIGKQIYQNLAPKHMDVFQLFDHIIVAGPETNYASKPNPIIYQQLLSAVSEKKQVILVDDKEKNLCGAVPLGIIGLQFRSECKLQQQLATLGIHLH